MTYFPNEYGAAGGLRDDAQTGQLATFFNTVYAWMAAGLALTAVVAKFISLNWASVGPVIQHLWLPILIVQLVLVFAISRGVQSMRMPVGLATGLFLLYSATNGLMLSVLFIVYPQATLVSALVVTAGTFGITSLWGFFTKKDLSGFGRILFMLLVGLVLASIVNMFVASTALNWALTYLGVAIFVGLTAYDTQALKVMALQMAGDGNALSRLAIAGALKLYLDFLNLFLFILQIMGNQERR